MYSPHHHCPISWLMFTSRLTSCLLWQLKPGGIFAVISQILPCALLGSAHADLVTSFELDLVQLMALRLNEGDEVEIEPDPATWTTLEEELYIQLMVKEVHKGNRSSATFSRKGWKQIEQEFCEKTNKRYNNSQFRNKFN
ncbi:hypothetical protein CsSME_00054310 [Camellia sinensis var. sinensis]